MAFPASRRTLASGLAAVDAAATELKFAVQKLRNDSAVGPVTRKSVLNLLSGINRAVTVWDEVSALSGIGAYVIAQKADPALNVGAEFTAMRAAAITLRDWINTNFPRDPATQAALTHVYDNAGNWTALTFSTAELAGYRTRADTLIATIG